MLPAGKVGDKYEAHGINTAQHERSQLNAAAALVVQRVASTEPCLRCTRPLWAAIGCLSFGWVRECI